MSLATPAQLKRHLVALARRKKDLSDVLISPICGSANGAFAETLLAKEVDPIERMPPQQIVADGHCGVRFPSPPLAVSCRMLSDGFMQTPKEQDGRTREPCRKTSGRSRPWCVSPPEAREQSSKDTVAKPRRSRPLSPRSRSSGCPQPRLSACHMGWRVPPVAPHPATS